mmetsp:Transcript_212/g.341  ORF Transcript_212/g.341 Transcript_212/m.341 type:complete len:219 (+) Transcript_212:32-688(+)
MPKQNFNWTETRKHRLACIVQTYGGHKKTCVSMKEKWAKILSKVHDDKDFSELSIKQDALKNQYERFKKTVLLNCEVSEEGQNSCGVSEKATEYTKRMVLLAKDTNEENKETNNKIRSAVQSEEANDNLCGSDDEISQDDESVHSNVSVDIDIGSESNKSSKCIETMAEMELRHKEQDFQDRRKEKRRRLEISERMLELQEEQVRLTKMQLMIMVVST